MRADDVSAVIAESQVSTEEAVRRRAYEIFCARGRKPGSELEDWLTAEREILGAANQTDAQNRATVVGNANPRRG